MKSETNNVQPFARSIGNQITNTSKLTSEELSAESIRVIGKIYNAVYSLDIPMQERAALNDLVTELARVKFMKGYKVAMENSKIDAELGQN
tara:strand:+ start:10384 stop:10656 length:273 start_codon:yes stop_codon:yes gene_type:complete